jgi:peptidoglycan/LPS O-acetylase OafA/YrhL
LTGGKAKYLVGHAWTLCYEEQFYAIAGILLLLAPKRIFLSAFIITLSIPFVVVCAYRNGIRLEGTIIGGAWLLFAAGIASYYRIHYAGQVGRLITSAMFSIAIFFPAFDSRNLIITDPEMRFSWVVSMLFSFALSALYAYDHELSKWRILWPFAVCGRICYSLYLIHPLVTTGVGHAFYRCGIRGSWQTLLVTLPVSVILSLTTSAAFYFLVEQQFLNSRHPSRKDDSALT